MTLPIVKRYLIAFEHYKLAGLATFVVGLGVSGAVGMMLESPPKPPYEATGVLTYKNPPVLFSETGQSIRQQGQQLTDRMLLQPRVIETVLTSLALDPRQFQRSLKVVVKNSEEGGGYIEVKYKDASRDRTVEVVNLLMEEMIEQSRLINTEHLRNIIDTIRDRMGPAEAELREAQNTLEDYDKREGATLLALESGALPQSIIANDNQLEQLQLQLEAFDAQIASLESRLGLTVDQAYVSQALTADPIIAELRVQLYQIESQLELLRKDYTDAYPPVAELLKQKQAAERQLQERASEVLGGDGIVAPLRRVDQIRVDSALDPARQQLAQNLIALQTEKETLVQQIESTREVGEKLRREYATIPNKQMEKLRLEQQVAYKQALYDKMQAQLADAQAAEAETVSSLQVAQEAFAPDVEEPPPPPNLILVMAIGGFGGVVGGAVLIFVLGMLSGQFYTWEEIQGAFREREVPVFGVVPNVMLLDDHFEEMPLLLNPRSPYLEAYEKVRSSLFRGTETAPTVVLITSTKGPEGKTLTAYNLAIATARAGKRTLLIEADLRSPSRVEKLRLAPDPQGRVEPLRYYGDLNECIRLVPDIANLYVIPSPGPLRGVTTVLESSEMRRLLRETRHRFDAVIVDAPALSDNNDALTLEPLTDGMVMVARPSCTASAQMNQLADQLMEEDDEEAESKKYRPRLLGAIINGADIQVDFDEEEMEGGETQPAPSALEQPALLPDDESILQLPSRTRY
ncbi:AAA family ATPase [Lyngbya sp. CCY1209]|uniref:GumC family protein n=1 Tax=Lyngbya sp. CCY1209 TaxID=2886103 RepID=UPI002D209A39|nr:AAA family ATPase [Lyngbya sp. CCY1209]MEB3885608.1 AAA family ATPase [Lyngbya sp. CCY1209]